MGEYAVIGLGRFGRALALEIQSLGNEVVGVDMDRQVVQEMSDQIREAIQADATSEATLRELGVTNLDAAVVAIGAPENSIMITLILKKLGVPYVIAKAGTDLHGEILNLVGADRVVYPRTATVLTLRTSRTTSLPAGSFGAMKAPSVCANGTRAFLPARGSRTTRDGGYKATQVSN
jgi:Trk K+ transport system NAD-binding subunit